MNEFDQAARYAAKLVPEGFLRWLLPRLSPRLAFRGWLDTRRVPFPGEKDRTCDTVADFVDSESPQRHTAVVVEFQSRPEGIMLDRLWDYEGRLNLELKTNSSEPGSYQVTGALVNLTGPPQEDTLEGRIPGMEEYGNWSRAVVQTLRNVGAADTLAMITAGAVARCLLPWIPLMHDGDEPGIIARWRQLAEAEPSALRRGQYGGLALVFAELAGRVPAWKVGLEGWNMGESQVINEWRAEGRADGELKRARATLLRALELRFKTTPPPEVALAVQASSDLSELSQWFDAAVTANSLDDFRAAAQL